MAEMRIGVANGGAMGPGAPIVAPSIPATPTPGAAGVMAGAVEAGVQPPTIAPVQAAPAQAAWTPPSAQVGPAVQAASPTTSPAPAQQPQAAPYTPPPPPGAAVPPPNFEISSPSSPPAKLAATDGLTSNTSNSTTLSSSSAAAIAIPLIVVALAILLLAGLIWWYKRNPTQGGASGSIRRRRTYREKDTASLSEKALLEIPGYETSSRMGSVRSLGSGRSTIRGVTVTPHLEAPLPSRPEPSVAPSIASIRRPTSMNIVKPLPPISEYGGSVRSGTTSRTTSTIPVIHSATVGRRADAQYVGGATPPPAPLSMHPTIMEEVEHTSEDETEASTTAPNSPRSRMRAIQKDHYSTTRVTSQYHSPPTASIYSTHSVTLPKSKRNGRSRRPIPQSVYSYTQSLPASIARDAPVSTVRRSPELPCHIHSPGSTADSKSLPEVDDFPADHPFAQKYTPSSSSYKTCEGDETESMVRSITARTELTLPWGFAEAKGKNGVKPLRQETDSSVVKLCREETRKGADWAREQKH